MDIRPQSPGIPEKTACKADERGKNGRRQSTFWKWDAVVSTGATLVIGILSEAWNDSKQKACKNGGLQEAISPSAPTKMGRLEGDQRTRFERL